MSEPKRNRAKRRKSCAPGENYSSSESPYIASAESGYESTKEWDQSGPSHGSQMPEYQPQYQIKEEQAYPAEYEIKQEQSSVIQRTDIEAQSLQSLSGPSSQISGQNQSLQSPSQSLQTSELQTSELQSSQNYGSTTFSPFSASTWFPTNSIYPPPAYPPGVSMGLMAPGTFSEPPFEPARQVHGKNFSISSHLDMMSFSEEPGFGYGPVSSYQPNAPTNQPTFQGNVQPTIQPSQLGSQNQLAAQPGQHGASSIQPYMSQNLQPGGTLGYYPFYQEPAPASQRPEPYNPASQPAAFADAPFAHVRAPQQIRPPQQPQQHVLGPQQQQLRGPPQQQQQIRPPATLSFRPQARRSFPASGQRSRPVSYLKGHQPLFQRRPSPLQRPFSQPKSHRGRPFAPTQEPPDPGQALSATRALGPDAPLSALTNRDAIVVKRLLQKLLPMLTSLDAYNFGAFLLSIISELDVHIPLDDFYNLLYNYETFAMSRFLVLSEARIDKTTTKEPFQESMRACHTIVEMFKEPDSVLSRYPDLGIDKARLDSVNFHELLRSFLGIKILKDILVQVDDFRQPAAIPRLSIYKVYFILCQKLITMYPSSINRNSIQKKIILGQSRIGKLIKVVYPDLVAKRLGRRGHSRYNYLGVTWNTDIVSDELLELSELNLPDLIGVFNGFKKRPDAKTSVPLDRKSDVHFARVGDGTFSFLPPSSFVKKDYFFPLANFDPRAWLAAPETAQFQNSWLKPVKEKCTRVLGSCNFNANLFMQQMANGELLQNPEWLLNSVVEGMEVLEQSGGNVDAKCYLHLFLVVLLSVFWSLVTPQHGSASSRLHANVETLLAHLPARTARFSWFDHVHLQAIDGVFKRMSNIWVLTQNDVQESTDKVLGEMKRDIDTLMGVGDASSEDGNFVLQSFVFSMKALSFTPSTNIDPADDGLYKVIAGTADFATKVVRQFAEALSGIGTFEVPGKGFSGSLPGMASSGAPGTEHTGALPGTASSEGKAAPHCLGFRVFSLMVNYLHDTLSTFSLCSELPIHFVATYLTQSLREAHKQIFLGMEQTDEIHSEATFRAWWASLSAIQEYISVIAELVSLVQFLEE